MRVKILTYTPNMEKVIATAGKLCYSNKPQIENPETMTDETVEKFIRQIMEVGHSSVLEHASITFAVEGVSRALLAELTRHRIGCSYSVRSQRYCSEKEHEFVTPKTLENANIGGKNAKEAFTDYVEKGKKLYTAMIDAGIPKEDARMLLHNATCTRLIVTMNVRALHHFFNLRCCNRAQWEIREMANTMLKECRKISPLLFEKAGASCVTLGYCPEGSRCCGRAKTLKELVGK